MRTSRLTTALLVLGVLALVVVSMLLGGDSEFTGTDNQAVTAIQQQDPGYRPWFASVLPPLSPSVDSGLFAAQAALGGGVLGDVLDRLRGRRSRSAEMPAPTPEQP